MRPQVFDYNFFEDKERWSVIKGIYRYPYLRHIIDLWPGDW